MALLAALMLISECNSAACDSAWLLSGGPHLHQELEVHIITLGGGAVRLLATPAGNEVDSLIQSTQ